MRYKLISFKNETLYFSNKKELFNFIDNLFKPKRNQRYVNWHRDWFSWFTNDFNYTRDTKIGRVFVGYETKFCYNRCYENYFKEVRSWYVSGYYKIKDENNFLVDYSKLKDEYEQSRQVVYVKQSRRRKYKRFDSSTKRYRQRAKYNYFKISKTSCKNEYSQLITESTLPKEEFCKMRDKRRSLLRCMNANMFLDEYPYRETSKTWKQNKKLKKQWQKRQQ